jgi:hypothetical protein
MREEDKSSVNSSEKFGVSTTSNSLLYTFQIDEIEYKVIQRSNSKIEGEKL